MTVIRPALAGADHAPPPVPSLTGLTVYGCRPDEAVLFDEVAPRFGVAATLTDAGVTAANVDLAAGTGCISVGHAHTIPRSTLLALRGADVSYISTRSVGYDHIDVAYAATLGITVETVAYSPESVADFTLMLMLMALRHAKAGVLRVDGGDYRLSPVRGRELRDMVVGVVGTGRIGRAVVDRLAGFGCRVLANDRTRSTDAHYVPLDELVEACDIVSLHVPLNEGTHHLLDRRRIARMRPGAFVVNTGRGPLLDTAALLDALEAGHLGGAALDVIEGEEGVFYTDRGGRPIGNELLRRLQRLPNVVVTAHTAYYTDHALRDIVEGTLANCLRAGGTPLWPA